MLLTRNLAIRRNLSRLFSSGPVFLDAALAPLAFFFGVVAVPSILGSLEVWVEGDLNSLGGMHKFNSTSAIWFRTFGDIMVRPERLQIAPITSLQQLGSVSEVEGS